MKNQHIFLALLNNIARMCEYIFTYVLKMFQQQMKVSDNSLNTKNRTTYKFRDNKNIRKVL